jgi:hypothetical protein
MSFENRGGLIRFITDEDFYDILENYCEIWDEQSVKCGKLKDFMLKYDASVIKAQINDEQYNGVTRFINGLYNKRLREVKPVNFKNIDLSKPL